MYGSLIIDVTDIFSKAKDTPTEDNDSVMDDGLLLSRRDDQRPYLRTYNNN